MECESFTVHFRELPPCEHVMDQCWRSFRALAREYGLSGVAPSVCITRLPDADSFHASFDLGSSLRTLRVYVRGESPSECIASLFDFLSHALARADSTSTPHIVPSLSALVVAAE